MLLEPLSCQCMYSKPLVQCLTKTPDFRDSRVLDVDTDSSTCSLHTEQFVVSGPGLCVPRTVPIPWACPQTHPLPAHQLAPCTPAASQRLPGHDSLLNAMACCQLGCCSLHLLPAVATMSLHRCSPAQEAQPQPSFSKTGIVPGLVTDAMPHLNQRLLQCCTWVRGADKASMADSGNDTGQLPGNRERLPGAMHWHQ